AVVIEPGRSVKRKLARCGEVLTTHFRRIDSKISRNKIERTLDDVSCFRTPGAAICIGGHLVGEAAGDVHLNRRNLVSAGEHESGQRGNSGCQQLMISAEIREDAV